MSFDFAKLAPYLQDPLVLVGFIVFLFFSFARFILKRGIIPPLTKNLGYRLLQTILLYGFIIGILIIFLGFGLKYRELSKVEQQRAVALLVTELEVNQKIVGELAANVDTLIGLFDTAARSVRHEGIPLLSMLFPESNLRQSLDDPSPSELANYAMDALAASSLHDDEVETAKATAAGHAIVATVDRTRGTVQSLGDPERSRYMFHREAYESHLQVLRRIDVVDVSQVQLIYSDLESLRDDYDVVVRNLASYLEALSEFFTPESGSIDRYSLTRVLTAERLAISMLARYTSQLVSAAEALREHSHGLEQAS